MYVSIIFSTAYVPNTNLEKSSNRKTNTINARATDIQISYLHIARNSSALSGRVPERLGYKLPGLMFVPADMAEIDIPRCFMYFDRAFVALSI